MARQLVVFSRWHQRPGFGHTPTNVVRILRSWDHPLRYFVLRSGSPNLRHTEALFQWERSRSRILGLAVGWGSESTVEEGINFSPKLSRWTTIYLFGFSRWAYAVRRSLNDHALWTCSALPANLFDYACPFSMLSTAHTKGTTQTYRQPTSLCRTHSKNVRAAMFLSNSRDLRHVSSVGWVMYPLPIAYSANNPSVRPVRQAVSIDDAVASFAELWNPAHPHLRIWFAGVHSDCWGWLRPAESQLALVAFR